MFSNNAISLIIALAWTTSASAQGQGNDYIPFNASQSAPSSGRQTWLEIERSKPDFTNQVTWDRWNNTQSSSNWKWTVSTYDVQSPNITVYDLPGSQMDRDVSNSSVAFTTYSFSWPEDGNLNAATAAGDSTGQSCLYFIDAKFPQNVSDAWDASSASCASAFGDSCVQAIMSQFVGSGCKTTDFPSQVSRDACAGSLGASENGLVIKAYPFGNDSAPSNSTSFQSGDVYGWALSDLYAPGNSTAFNQAADLLRMIVVTDSTQNNILSKQILCNRAGPESSGDADTSAAMSNLGARGGVVLAMAVLVAMMLVI